MAEAIAIYEPLLADRERILGAEHPDTLSTRHNLAFAYQAAGRVAEAIAIFEPLLADSERILGAEHPDTLATRHNLAGAYRAAGRVDEAIAIYEPLLAERERILGPAHPSTLTTRNNLAGAYRSIGRDAEAAALQAEPSKRCAITRPLCAPGRCSARHRRVDDARGRVGRSAAAQLGQGVFDGARQACTNSHPNAVNTTSEMLSRSTDTKPGTVGACRGNSVSPRLTRWSRPAIPTRASVRYGKARAPPAVFLGGVRPCLKLRSFGRLEPTEHVRKGLPHVGRLVR